MKKDLMFELFVTDSLKIRVYEDKEYDTLFEDSYIYIVYNGKEKKMLQYSFVYVFGLQMYQRLYNINDYEYEVEIEKYLENNLNIDHKIENYDEYSLSKQRLINLYDYFKFIFAECAHDYVLLLYKKDEKYLFSIVKHTQHKTKRTFKSKLLCTYELSEEQIIDWREKVKNAFSIRKRKECELVDGHISDETWASYMERQKDEKNDYFKS